MQHQVHFYQQGFGALNQTKKVRKCNLIEPEKKVCIVLLAFKSLLWIIRRKGLDIAAAVEEK